MKYVTGEKSGKSVTFVTFFLLQTTSYENSSCY